MKIAVISATLAEIQPLLSGTDLSVVIPDLHFKSKIKNTEIDFYISGIGMTAMAYCCGKNLSAKYDLAINAGIAGAFDRDLKLGEAVNVTTDTLSELGAEDGDRFITLDEMGLAGDSKFKIKDLKLQSAVLKEMRSASGITVNTVHGEISSIDKIIKRLNPQIESMEGAAFLYACDQAGVTGLQIRAISNYVEKRNRAAWNIPLAVKNLNEKMVELLNAF